MGGGVPPPVSGPPAALPAGPATPPLAEATVVQLPPRLQDVGRTVVVTGTVAGETPEGLTRVRTQAGEVLLDSDTPLPPDKPVTLQLSPGGQGQTAKAQIFARTPAGQPVPTTATPPTAAQAQPAVVLATLLTGTAAPNNAARQPLLPGALVPALVLASVARQAAPGGATAPALPGQPAPPTAATQGTATAPTGSPAGMPAGTPPGAPAGLQPGTPGAAPPGGGLAAPPAGGGATFGVPVELGGDAAHPGGGLPTAGAPDTADAPNGAPDAAPRPPSGGLSANAPSAGGQGTGRPSTPPPLAQGATLALKILSVTPPGGQGAAPPPVADPQGGTPPFPDGADGPESPPNAPVVRGTVAGTTPQGQPVLATRQGMLALNTQAPLPVGTQVTAAITDRAAAQALEAPGGGALFADSREWPALRQVLTALAALDRGLAQSVMNSVLPQPNRKLGAALGFLMSALRGGDARGWLGEEATSALERAGRGDLLSRLDEEFRAVQRQSADPLPGDWRPYAVPMYDGQALRPVQVHVHPIQGDEENDGPGGRRERGSRFVIDVDLSVLGPMQLDGMVRERRFDLILRSQAALTPELRVELTQVFTECMEAVGYGGGLNFQAGARGWVKLTRAGRRGTLGVTA